MNGNKPKVKNDNSLGMKILCYFGIIICLTLIIVPPVLRKTKPKPKEDPTKNEKSAILSCNTSDNGEVVVVSYKGNDELIGEIKYTFVADAESWIASELHSDLDKNTNVTRRLIESKTEPNKMQFLLSPEEGSSHLSMNQLATLSANVRQEPVYQRIYYEDLGFTCNLTEEEQPQETSE